MRRRSFLAATAAVLASWGLPVAPARGTEADSAPSIPPSEAPAPSGPLTLSQGFEPWQRGTGPYFDDLYDDDLLVRAFGLDKPMPSVVGKTIQFPILANLKASYVDEDTPLPLESRAPSDVASGVTSAQRREITMQLQEYGTWRVIS